MTSTGSGLAVPDWPLSYGSLTPPMVGGIFYEHGHRMIATFVGFLTAILAIWLWWKEERRRVKQLGVIALMTVIAQGLLGGVTVLLLLPPPVSIAHATLAQTFFCLTVSIALFTSPWWVGGGQRGSRSLASLSRPALMTTVAVYLQLIFGAMLRHGIRAFLYVHIAGAMVVTVFTVWFMAEAMRRYYDERGFRWGAFLLIGLLMLQIALGVANFILKVVPAGDIWPPAAKVALATSHVAIGALLLAVSLLLTLGSHRLFVPSREALVGVSSSPIGGSLHEKPEEARA